jgi:predicted  nucleic acid-binding Zn-ribbon protein
MNHAAEIKALKDEVDRLNRKIEDVKEERNKAGKNYKSCKEFSNKTERELSALRTDYNRMVQAKDEEIRALQNDLRLVQCAVQGSGGKPWVPPRKW